MKYSLAGFPSGASGAWTYCEIQEGDFISFLYGARAHNLYTVVKREALRDAEHLPPWKPLTFKESGKTYSFPFRLHLQPIRVFSEPLVRAEFSYVAENLLLRGGYRKTHFQADQTTLQSVSEMGVRSDGFVVPLSLPSHTTFIPRFTRSSKLAHPPEVCRFQETILQSAIRRHLISEENLQRFLAIVGLVEVRAAALEILSEKALTQGHIDLLLKQRVPLGSALKVPIEVKMSRATPEDVSQLRGYMDELRGECLVGVLIAADFAKQVARKTSENGIRLLRYSINADLRNSVPFEEICQGLSLSPLGV